MPGNKRSRGFTLFEMLIVITIISILSAALIPRIMAMQDKARTSKVIVDMNVILNAIYTQRLDYSEKRLLDITNNSWSAQGCWSGDIRNISTGSLCYQNWVGAASAILGYVSIATGNFVRDPWGSPYMLDENDGELLNAGGCGYDILESAGPNGLSGALNGGELGVPRKSTTSDSIFVLIPKLPRYVCP